VGSLREGGSSAFMGVGVCVCVYVCAGRSCDDKCVTCDDKCACNTDEWNPENSQKSARNSREYAK